MEITLKKMTSIGLSEKLSRVDSVPTPRSIDGGGGFFSIGEILSQPNYIEGLLEGWKGYDLTK